VEAQRNFKQGAIGGMRICGLFEHGTLLKILCIIGSRVHTRVAAQNTCHFYGNTKISRLKGLVSDGDVYRRAEQNLLPRCVIWSLPLQKSFRKELEALRAAANCVRLERDTD
jgi:hypothetical protein